MEMSGKKVDRNLLETHLASTLDINRFRDYCPNGLQVEGGEQVQYLVSGVTASLALIEAALEKGADALLVHHGYFWKGEDPRIVGHRQKRLKLLLANGINLFAYHLPLDAHPVLGNNAQLGQRLGLKPEGRFGEQDLGWLGVASPEVTTVGDFAALVERVLGRVPLVIGNPDQTLGKVGWCTGAAQNALADAITAGVSVYLSGEISEQTVHLARESQVAYLACGHHATERYGVQALGQHIENQFGIRHEFIDVPNPV
jgi:dinuclear metal center YbgI/SA1388 family protein